MRQIVFRVLAALLALAFVWVIAFRDDPGMDLRTRAGCLVVAVTFGLYSLRPAFGENFLGGCLGFREPNERSRQGDHPGKAHGEDSTE